MKNLAKEARESIGNWSSDYAAEKVRQQVAWPVPPSMEVDFPGCVFARYSTSAEIEPTRQRTHNTILFTGMAVHREIGRTAGGTSRRDCFWAALETGPTTRSDWST